MIRRVAARLVLLITATAVLCACHVDVTVDVSIGTDGTGSMTLTALADAEVVQQAPGLAADLRFDDAVAAGWTVDGPTATEDGGLRVALTHPVTSAAEATNLLNSLGPPFTTMSLERVTSDDGDTTTMNLSGQLVLAGGFDAFADSDLLAAVGGTPFAASITAAGATPADALGIALRAELPGEVEESSGKESDDAQVWSAPLDGSTSAVVLRTVQKPGGAFSSLLATVLLLLLVAWIGASTVFIVSVVRARARKASRRRRALSRLR